MNMKRFISVFLIFALALFALAACTQEQESGDSSSVGEESRKTESKEELEKVYSLLEKGDYKAAHSLLYSFDNRSDEAEELFGRFKVVSTKLIDIESGNFTTLTYDENGNLTKYPSSENIYEYTYNEQGYVIKEHRTDLVYDEEMTVEHSYDENGNLVKRVTTFIRDDNTWVTVDEFTYDNHGNVVVSLEEKGSSSERRTETEYTYDSNGNILKKVIYFKSSGRIEERTYDENGLMTELYEHLEDSNSYLREKYTYDEHGNLSEVVYETNRGTTTKNYTNDYDEYGNLIKQADSDGRIEEWSYDKKGNLLKHSKTDSNGTETVVDDNTYDENGLLIQNKNCRYEGFVYFYYPDGVPEFDYSKLIYNFPF